ncbi:fasciclin domain-containing protein [Leptolyngbya sp. AN02str]|uniref:fasciclin domain-containing protein n=1 Tax=Leptolyngbya sp. AN02str TaxID=3423363 RepID=UPI003D311211
MKSAVNSKLVKKVAGFAALASLGFAVALPAIADTHGVDSTSEMEAVESVPAAELEAVPAPEDGMTTPGSVEVPTAPGAAEVPTAPDMAPTAMEGTVVDVAEMSGSFNTLLAALTEAGLAETLRSEGPFTVFAPTDEAFAALPEGVVDQLLLPENRDLLVQVLSYHVVPGTITSDELTSGEVATVEGSSVTVAVGEGTVEVNDANVTQADIAASNGVIHAIDRVILPPGLQ